MRHADAAPRHEEVLDIARVEAAIGHGVTVTTIDSFAVHGLGNKWIVRIFLGVLFLGIMQIDTPGAGHATIREIFLRHDVLFGEQNVAVKAARFAWSAYVGHPGQEGVAVLRRSIPILHGVEGPEHGPQVPVADAFGVLERVLVVTTFPKPLAMIGARVGEILHVQVKGPRGLGELPRLFFLCPCPHVAHAHAPFRRHGEIGSSQVPDGAVPGAVGKQGTGEAGACAGADVEGMDREDSFVGRFHLVGVMI